MAKAIHTSYDFLKTSEIQNAIIQVLSSAPGSPNEGQIYYNSTDETMYICTNPTGPVWLDLGANDNTLGPDGDKGDITVGGTGTTLTIDDEAVTFAKMQHIATDSFLGRDTAGTGDIEVLSGATATSLLDLFSTVATTKGLVPGSNGATTQFLRGDGTWASPAGGFADFLVGGDTGADQTINDGDLLDITGGTGVNTTVSKVSTTVTLDIDLDYLGVDNFIDSATNLEGTGIATGDTIIYHDATDNNVKKGFVSDLPFSNNAGTVTSIGITPGALIDVTGSPVTTSGNITVDVDLSELTDMVAAVNGAQDELVLLDNGLQRRKLIGEITLSSFDDDLTYGTGSVTSVSAGNGLDFTTITTTGAVTMGTPGGLTSATTNDVTATSHTHSLDISGFASTVLSDTSNIAYLNGTETITGNWTIDTGTSLTITDAPSASTDAANKAYVDSVAQGLDAKESVVAATTANGALATAYENGDTIDGVVLVTGERILIKDQTAADENGIYIVQATGAPVRASDANSWDELVSAFVFVEEGTINADTGWVCTSDAGGTLETTAVTFAQFSGAGSYTAGDGLDLTGSEFSLALPSSLTGTSSNAVTASSHTHEITTGISDNSIVAIDSASVATGEYARFTANGLESRTAAEIITELGIPQKFTGSVNAATTTVFSHNFGTRDVVVTVYRSTTPWDVIDCDVEMDSTNAVSVTFNTAPSAGEYDVVIIG